MRINYLILTIIFIWLSPTIYSQNIGNYQELSTKILDTDNPEKKLLWSSQLNKVLLEELRNADKITPLDSTALLYELISRDNKIQIVTWGIVFNNSMEYYGILKTYNEINKKYQVFDLVSTDFIQSINTKELFTDENWPAGIYFKIIENHYKNKTYYTFLGWLSPLDQTGYKFIEVLSLNKSGKPYFGKINHFKKDRNYSKRQLFSYSRQSKFLLDYGSYSYSIRKWNRKKKKYELDEYNEDLIVFDHLISKYPNMKALPEFMVPVGNLIDAYKFDKGKWIFVSDIDARNMKRKVSKKKPPTMNLFAEPDKDESN